jgi:ADP-heptose:LPS heptosyltransferase
MLEKFQEGFKEYEWRKKSKSFSDYVNYSKLNLKSKVWNGENLNNKKLLVIAEQGIGDLIQFSRYLYLIKKKYNVEIILLIKSKKFSHFFDQKKFKIISQGDKIPDHDYHNHMISLLKIFLKENNLFCKPVNFFQKNEKAEIKWSERLKKYKGLKVGINSSTSHRVRKDIPMKYFAQFIVIQKEVSKNELKEISNKKNILHFPDLDSSKQAFIDSIEIIKNLDLVITADTATAHLSATLGKKTWILLPFVADWRWFLDESKSKWYENVVLYRSKKIDDWDSPFKMIEKDLKKDFC